MAKLIIEGMTPEQVKTLANWYEGEGEQSCGIWFECNGVEVPYVDCRKEYITEENGDMTIFIQEQE